MGLAEKLKIDKPLFRSIFTFAIPVLFDQGFVAVLLTANTMMCADAGTAAVSAVGMVDSVHMLIAQFFVALATGGTVVVAQCMGRRDTEAAKKSAKQALITGTFLAAVVSIIVFLLRAQILAALFGSVEPDVMHEANRYFYFSIFSYPFMFFTFQGFGVLRGSGNSKTPMLINLTSTLVNLAVGIFLIMGVKMGTGTIGGFGPFGAGITFFISRVTGCTLVFLAITSKKSPARVQFREKFQIDWNVIGNIYRIGIPASTESLLFMFGKLICQIFITTMGTTAIAVNSIASSLTVIHTIPGNSMGIVATTLVGRQVGAGSEENAKKTLWYCNLIAFVFIILFFFPFFFFANQLAGLYSNVPEIIEGSAYVLKTYVIACVIWPLAFVLPSGFRGAGDAMYPLVTAIGTMWLLRVMLGYYLGVTLHLGVLGIFIGMYADWVARVVIYARRFVKEGWLKLMRRRKEQEAQTVSGRA